MTHIAGIVFACATLAVALSAQKGTRDYLYDQNDNRVRATNQVRFTGAEGFRIEPRRALIGEPVNVYGRNFPAGDMTNVQVTFGGAVGNVLSVASRVITVEVPQGFTGGDIDLRLFGGASRTVGTVTVEGVVVTPAVAALEFGATQQFGASVIGTANQMVTWSVNGVSGGNTQVGTISPSGLYTAPAITTQTGFPYLVEAYSPALNLSGYALANLSCTNSSPIADETLTAGMLSSPFERHCWEFSGRALKRAFVAFLGTSSIRSLTLRASNGVVLATSGPGTTLTIPDVLLPLDDMYRIEVQGDATPGGAYQVWLDEHDELPFGVWMLPASSSWQNPGNWSRGVLPQSSDDVSIADFPGDLLITVGAAVACRSLVSEEDVSIVNRGRLAVVQTAQVHNDFTLAGGTLADATVVPGRGGESLIVTSNSNNRIDGVTFQGDLELALDNSVTRVLNDLSVTGTLRMTGQNVSLGFEGTQSIRQGAIVFESPNGNGFLEAATRGATVRIAPGVTLRGGRGQIGGSRFFGQQMHIVNQGMIAADQTGLGLTIDGRGGGTFTNRDTVTCAPGASLSIISDTTTNDGTISSNGAFSISDSWTNSGAIILNAGSATLGGTFTSLGLGTFTNNGAAVELSGRFDLRGKAFTLDGGTGSWQLLGGRIQNGTLIQAGGAVLDIGSNSNNRIDGVTIQGDLVLSATNAVTRILNDLDVTGTVRLQGSNSSLGFEGSQTIRRGTISFETPTGNGFIEAATSGALLTIAPGVTIQGGRGQIGGSRYFGRRLDIVNQGTIAADQSGLGLTVDGRGGSVFTNDAAVTCASGASLSVIADTTINNGTITSDGTFAISDSWSNPGTMMLNAGSASLGGSFTSTGLGAFMNNGAAVDLVGAFDLGGGTFTLNGGTGTWRLLGGRIQNGTLAQAGGAVLDIGSNSNNRIDGVTIQGDLVLSATNAVTRILNDLDVTGTVRLQGSNSSLGFEGSQTIRRGTISFETPTGNGFIEAATSGALLTIAPGVTIQGGRGQIGGSRYFGRRLDIVNMGTIAADQSGLGLTVDGRGGSVFTNDAAVTCASGASLSIVADTTINNGTITSDGTFAISDSWSNPGTMTLNNGTAALGGSFTSTGLGTFMNNGAAVDLTGVFDLGGGTFTLDGGTGTWRLLGGRLQNGTLAQAGGAVLDIGSNSNNRIDGVTIQGDLVLSATNAVTRILNDLDVTGTVRLQGSNSSLGFEGSQTIRRGTISFETPTGNGFLEAATAGSVVTIAPGVILRGGRGQIGGSRYFGQRLDIVNMGTIAADQSGLGLTVDGRGGSVFTNDAAVTCASGASLSIVADTTINNGTITSDGTFAISDSWSNPGTMTLNNGTAALGGSFTATSLGTFMNNGAAVDLTGVFDLGGGTFTLNGGTGTWRLLGGRIQNGTLAQAGGAVLDIGSNSNNRIDGVTIQGDLVLSATNAVTRILNDLDVTGTVRLQGSNSGLGFEGSQTIRRGTVSFEVASGNGFFEAATAGSVVTIAPGVILRGGRGQIGGSRYFGQRLDIVNMGTIAADQSGLGLTVDGRGGSVFTNDAAVTCASGASLSIIADTTINNGTITSDGTFAISDSWSNPGTVTLNAGTAALGGSFTATALGTFMNNGAAVDLTGVFDLGGGTFTLNGGTGTWRLLGGRIQNGTLAQAGGAVLDIGSNGNNRIDGVTIQGDLVLSQTNAVTRILNDLDVTGTVRMQGTNSSLGFEGSQTIRRGTISFESSSGNGLIEAATSGAILTIAPGVTIQGGRGQIGGSRFFGQRLDIVNQGTIVADQVGLGLTIDGRGGSVFTNDAAVTCATGASLSITADTTTNNGTITSSGAFSIADSWTNPGTMTLNAGTAVLGGSFTAAGLGTFMNNGAAVDLTGVFDLGGGTFTLNGGTGTWRLLGGRIQNGTLVQAGSAMLGISANSNNRIDDVTIQGDLVLSEAGAVTRVLGDLDVLGTVRFQGANSVLAFEGSPQSIARGVVSFEANSGTSHIESATAGLTLTVASGVTIQGGRGRIGGSRFFGQRMDLVNQGTITATVAGQPLSIDGRGGTHSNSGTIDLFAPGTISGGLSNSGTLRIAGAGTAGTLQISSGYAQTSTGRLEVDLAGSTVGTGFDQLTVTGTVSLAGTLAVNVVGPFAPMTNEQFLILNSGMPSGTFANAVPNFNVSYEAVGVRLTAQ